MEVVFGSYVRAKRKECRLTLRAVCEKLGYSVSYICDIENERRRPPEKEKLDQMVALFNLSEEEKVLFYDLAGKARETVPPDLKHYIMDKEESEAVRFALRTARDKQVSADDWMKVADVFEKKQAF